MDWQKKAKQTAESVMDEINDAYYTTQEAECEVDPEQFIQAVRRHLESLIDEWQENALDEYYTDEE